MNRTVVSAFDMGSILKALDINAREKGNEWKATCPDHYNRLGKMDRKPSWSINNDTGLFNCFSCGFSGTLVDLVMYVTEMSLWEAYRWLRDEGFQTLEIQVRDDAAVVETETALTNLMETFEDEWYLFPRPPKRARVSRHITRDSCEHYDLRWNDGGWCIPIKTYRSALLGYQWKRNSIVDNRPEDMKKSETLFGIDTFPGGDVAVLLESPLDAARLWCCGYDGGLAAFGVYVSNDQLSLITSFTDRVIVALDNDVQGRLQSRELYERLRHAVPTVRFLDYRQCDKREDGKRPKDIGEMTESEIHAAIRHAKLGPEAVGTHLIPAELPEKKEKADVRRPSPRDGDTRRTNDPANKGRSAQGRKRPRRPRGDHPRKASRRR